MSATDFRRYMVPLEEGKYKEYCLTSFLIAFVCFFVTVV